MIDYSKFNYNSYLNSFRACFIINVKSRGCIVWGEFCFEPKEHSELCDCGEKRKSPKICDRAAHFLLKIVILEKLNWNEEKFAHICSEKMAQKYFKNNNIHLKISNLEGLAHLLKTGCQWRLLPEYYGAWQTIYYHFRTLWDKEIFCKIKRKLLKINELREERENTRP